MLDINNLEVAYGAGGNVVKALKSLDLHVGKGDYVAVLGANGSGKSTLIKAICGLVPFEGGEIKFSGRDIAPGKFGEELFGRIAVVFQEPGGQFLMPTVEREVHSVLENLGLLNREQKEAFEHIVDILSLRPMLTTNPRSLSGGQMQLANLGCALAVNPEMILLDEPTTFLDAHYRNLLLEYVDSLHKFGLTVLHVTQYPDEALRAGRVIILDSGQVVADGNPGKLLADEELLLQHRLTMPRNLAAKKWLGLDYALGAKAAGNHIKEKLKKTSLTAGGNEKRDDAFFLLKNVKFMYGKGQFAIDIEKLRLFRDEPVGLIGPAGSGKSTLAFLLAALLKPERGEILSGGITLSDLRISKIRQRVGITWQMPDPAFIGPTVEDEIVTAAKNLHPQGKDIDQVLSKAGLTGFNDRVVDTLSGGEKRKLSLACALAGNPDYLILDEPSAFLDPAAQLDVQQTVRRLADSGTGVMIIGHDIPFISELAERVIGLKEGMVILDLPADEFFTKPACLGMLGLPGEPLISFRKRLADKGAKIPFGSLDPRRLAAFMREAGIRWQEFT